MRAAIARTCLIGAWLTACGGSTPDPGGSPVKQICNEASGSRILLDRWVAPGGGFVRLALWDDELDGYCEIQQYGGGDVGAAGWYCVPTDVDNEVYFQQPDCTQPYVATGSPAEPPAYAWRADADGCGSARLLYPVGASLSPSPAAAYQVDDQGACVETSLPDGPYLSVGDPLLPGQLVAMSEELVGDGRVVQPRFTGADGSTICGELRDELFAADCRLLLDQPGVHHCAPTANAPRSVFTDASCSDADNAIVVGSCPDAAASYAARPEREGCVARPVVYQLAAPDAEPRYHDDGGGCEPIGTPGETWFSDLGAVVEPSSMPAFERYDEPATGRLWRQLLIGPDGLAVFAERWRDTELGIDCRHEPINDVTAYCRPVGLPNAMTAFSDAACTVEIQIALQPAAGLGCASGEPPYAIGDSGSEISLWTLTPRDAPAFVAVDGGCDELTEPAFDLVRELPWSMLVRFERAVD